MELGHTPPIMPRSSAIALLSTPKGFPASAPALPNNVLICLHVFTLREHAARGQGRHAHLDKGMSENHRSLAVCPTVMGYPRFLATKGARYMRQGMMKAGTDGLPGGMTDTALPSLLLGPQRLPWPHLSPAAAWPRAAAGRAGAYRRAATRPHAPAASGSIAPPAHPPSSQPPVHVIRVPLQLPARSQACKPQALTDHPPDPGSHILW